jgi:hypothetical protein
VNFDICIGGISGSGLTRTVAAKVTNAGKEDAHNVWAKLQVLSRGAIINVCGRDCMRVDIGKLKAGETVHKQVTAKFGFLDGLNMMQNGARVALTINSDEGMQTFNYDFTP